MTSQFNFEPQTAKKEMKNTKPEYQWELDILAWETTNREALEHLYKTYFALPLLK